MAWPQIVGAGISAAGKAGTPMPAGPSISDGKSWADQKNDGWTVNTGGSSGGLDPWLVLGLAFAALVALKVWKR